MYIISYHIIKGLIIGLTNTGGKGCRNTRGSIDNISQCFLSESDMGLGRIITYHNFRHMFKNVLSLSKQSTLYAPVKNVFQVHIMTLISCETIVVGLSVCLSVCVCVCLCVCPSAMPLKWHSIVNSQYIAIQLYKRVYIPQRYMYVGIEI